MAEYIEREAAIDHVYDCKTCKHFNGCAVVGNKDEPCYSCLKASGGWLPNYEEATEKMTNADRIRAMTDEELAEYLSDIGYASYETGVWGSQKNWLDWLRQEATE